MSGCQGLDDNEGVETLPRGRSQESVEGADTGTQVTTRGASAAARTRVARRARGSGDSLAAPGSQLHRRPLSAVTEWGPSLNICHRTKWKQKAQVQIPAPPHTSWEDAPRFSDSLSILAEESNTKSSSQGCEEERAS